MNPKTVGTRRGQNLNNSQRAGPNWVFIVGGALLSTLSIRIGSKLKQAFQNKQLENAHCDLKGSGKSAEREKSVTCPLHADMHCFKQEGNSYYSPAENAENALVSSKQVPASPTMNDSHPSLPLVTIPSIRENSTTWVTSPEHLQLPSKPFQHSYSSDSLCISETGSDIFIKREVIQKLRQQLKRRDEMIMEMQAQITDLQNAVASETAHSAHLQSQVDSTNHDLFDSEREIQQLRKAIADHCVANCGTPENSSSMIKWHSKTNGHANGYVVNGNIELSTEKDRDGHMVGSLKEEVRELKEVIEGKKFLLTSYKEQKLELSSKVNELEVKLASHVQNIL